ncbi:MAG: hypothetical protein H6810_02960 [Phycisphaeraceae bacterium]|nr:MAG: hypothetical protein H6810_02960 [Phycisphaeraceae bacterium]
MRTRDRSASIVVLAAAVGVIGAAGAAQADPFISFRFGELSGDYVYESGVGGGAFTAAAVTNDAHVSNGDITRLDDRPGTGEFDPGFTLFDPFAVQVVLNITDIAGDMALATGSVLIADGDGDTLTADINGVLTRVGSTQFFNGQSTNFAFSGAGDMFDGTDGAIMIDDLKGQFYTGAVSFEFDASSLTQDFAEVTTNIDGLLIPSPAILVPFLAYFGYTGRRWRG